MAETWLVDGVDLSTHLYSIQGVSGSVGAPSARGGDYEMPRRGGALTGVRWAGARALQIRGLLYGNDGANLIPADARARYLDRARALAVLVWSNGEDYTVTRTIPRASGGDLTTEATGRYLGGLDPEQVAAHAGRVAFDIALLDPNWWATSDTTLSTITTTLTPTIVGDLATQRITLTFSGVTGTQRLTNSTTGEYVEITGSNAASTVLDCRDFTATRSGSSVAGSVTHSSSFESWLSLVPGSNSLTLTGGGQVVVAYRAAWL